ncbi:hypothetical protein HPP92_005461 [Vanilla planifolia]|uniref:peptidyl-tRNA hydrolase n=1 Tax=Vanilla planifolia TaxID=51239 RepID=A0A835VD79_VANPL|nr:hypothetical protein HPP92_005798 [Vanilla planifolia]KAG0494467.1 hypothetical protein HPP92_005461 [Vanilla planifolia]
MGVSVSILSASATAFFGVACFAVGYFLAVHSLRSFNSAGDDDCEKNGNKGCKGARWFLSWVQAVVWGNTGARMNADVKEAAGNRKSKHSKPAVLEIESLAEIFEDFKMVLVVRNELKMGKGKIAAQCSHATLGLYKKLHNRASKALSRWEMCGQVKVVLKIESEEDMLVLQERAKSLKLPTHTTIDAGRTQIAPNSRTVMAILGPADMVDDVTGGLKLL